ncbi:MAG: GDSL-type esterase/lipase family protein [Bacteroidaceae bacterium]|nr:GDSL-type esterase/lipase family protein [Bacteroidaceae bacterium]
MKKTVLLLLAMLMVLSVAARGVKKINVVFIGNSITYGAEINHLTEAPPVRVAEMLRSKGYEVEYSNCGVSGSTTVDWLPERNSRIFSRMVSEADRLATKQGLLIFTMMLGTNDSAIDCCNGSPVNPVDYAANVKKIVDFLLDRYPGARVIVNYPIWYSPHTYNGARYLHQGLDRLQTYLPRIDAICKDYAKERPQRVFLGSRKTFSYFKDRTDLFVAEPSALGQGLKFYLHPNPEGAIRLARFWTESIEKVARR